MARAQMSFQYTVGELLEAVDTRLVEGRERIPELEAQIDAYPAVEDFSDGGYRQHRDGKRALRSELTQLGSHIGELERWRRVFGREAPTRKLKLHIDDVTYFGL